MEAVARKAVASTVRAGLQRICEDFTVGVAGRGFLHTKKRLWVRLREMTADFIAFETGRPPINHSVWIEIRCGIRLINDDFVALALNGPSSDAATTRAGRYHLRFNARSWDQYDRCAADLLRFTSEIGEPWFGTFATTESLLDRPDSPLTPSARTLLEADLAGMRHRGNETLSSKLLGLPD